MFRKVPVGEYSVVNPPVILSLYDITDRKCCETKYGF